MWFISFSGATVADTEAHSSILGPCLRLTNYLRFPGGRGPGGGGGAELAARGESQGRSIHAGGPLFPPKFATCGQLLQILAAETSVPAIRTEYFMYSFFPRFWLMSLLGPCRLIGRLPWPVHSPEKPFLGLPSQNGIQASSVYAP